MSLRGFFCFCGGNARRIAPVHLARANPCRRPVPRIDDGVRLDMLGHGPGEQAILQFLLARLALAHHFQILRLDMAIVAILHQHAARDDGGGQPRTARIGQLIDQQQAQVLLGGKSRNRGLVRTGGDHDFGEDFADRGGGGAVQRDIGGDDAAEGRHRIARQRLVPCLHQAGALRNTAGVGMFDDHHRRVLSGEFSRQFQRGIGIVVIIVGQFLALQLAGLRNTRAERAARSVERRLLMGVFAIAQRRHQIAGHGAPRREFFRLVNGGEPAGDHRIISGGRAECLGRHRLAEVETGRPVPVIKLGEQGRIIGRISQNGDEGVILGRRTYHRRATNIDILDHLVPIGAAPPGRLERIEIDNDQIDRTDRVSLHRGGMFGIVAYCQQAAVHLGVQRLDPPVHHFGKAGELRNIAHRQPRIAQRPSRAAGGHQFHPAPAQCLAQFDQAGLVGH